MCTFQPRVEPRVIKDDTEDKTEVPRNAFVNKKE
jgi:hypothetical protein